MTCADAKLQLHEYRRHRLDPALHAEVSAHLESCARCGDALRAEEALDEALERRLPRHTAPNALHRRLALLVGHPRAAKAPAAPRRWVRIIAPALAAGLAVAAGLVALQRARTAADAMAVLTAEAINDHLRVLAREQPVDVESGGRHEVKPWFEGKLDFAPEVPTADPLRLRGGSVGYVFDRKAAVLVYALRLHAVTLLVFRADGLAWPAGDAPRSASARGFHVVLWRSGELGYALVSDASADELAPLAARLAADVSGGPPR